MLSERMQRRLDALLDEADVAVSANDWTLVADKARAALALDEADEDAAAFLRMAEANLGAPNATFEAGPPPPAAAAEQPASFAAGRYQVKKFLGEGGKKRVFLAYDALLDRDVAFALIKTDGLDDTGRERVTREAQAMGRMGAHPHVVSVFDLGEEQGAPYIVTELMGGGDVEGELERTGGPLELSRSLDLAKGVARGLAFAHERGVVHRDLKPGNVWLTSDGVAKIGDFGLAVAEGRSRLTQHGLMVGTFAYMPPEQALGGEATPRSDLYSLGAMLYELVTGRPPFEGDSPTAVISQHLNTAPVAPSWHTEHCPPALEDLILALLQKDPASRPASASEVLASLEGIDPAQPSRSRSSDSANPLDRLARGVFVGRERELERLRTALDQALAGRGSVVMLVGEPGIGKTRTTQELETYARMRGAKVLWGRAHESSGAPPYWPWVQVARAYREETPDAEVRRRQYEPYAVELQRIFPALRDLFPHLAEPPPETEEGQFRLFDAFSAFARSVAQETPLVFVLDDLHWADAATLGLLTHLARELARARILVVGTYRDTDLDRRHPLAAALAELGREDLFSRVNLRGLTSEETEEYLRQTAHIEPAKDLVARIFEETEGNPFFLSEVVNLMTEEGSFNASVSDIAVPEGVRQALGRRLDRLSEDANELLTVLAVAGRDFDHVLVQALSTHDDAATLRLLEEALRARVLEEVGAGRYRFTHALMQETLAEELSAARRVLLHGQIAEAMERLYGEDSELVAAIAGHLIEAATLDRSLAAKAAIYSYRAADRAASALAYRDAVDHYQHCIEQMQAADGSPGIDEAALYYGLGHCQWPDGNAREAWRNTLHAMEIYASREDDWVGLAKATFEVLQRYQVPPARLLHFITSALQAAGERDPVLETRLRARRLLLRGPLAEVDDDPRAIRLSAEQYRLESVLADLDERDAESAGWVGRFPEAASLAGSAAARRFAAGESSGGLNAMLQQAHALSLSGLSDEYERVLHLMLERARATRELYWEHMIEPILVIRSLAHGDVDAAQALNATIDYADSLVTYNARIVLAELVGRGATGLSDDQLFPPMSMGGRVPILMAYAYGLTARSHLLVEDKPAAEQAVAQWGQWAAEWTGHPANTVAGTATIFGAIGDAVVDAGDDGLVRWSRQFLLSRPSIRSLVSCSADRIRGRLELRASPDSDAVTAHFEAGLEWSLRERYPIEAGRCHQGLAEVAERRGQHAEATQHLDAAGELFARHGAKLYLDQVIAKKEILKA